MNRKFLFAFLFAPCFVSAQPSNDWPREQHRPQFHFSPRKAWMNDPNGMVYRNGTYHLFYQFYPDSTVWGPMHWGHARSKDLVHWTQQPVALYPDSLGWIFSGSAVADVRNTSGFGKKGAVPLVAMFTHHNSALEKAGRADFQYQSLAYSLDEGKTWTKYSGNPVIKNPGLRDFRDPKLVWYEAGKKWMVVLAAGNRVEFYSSRNLKDWKKESEFGEGLGAHGGVWECPELLPMEHKGKTVWVLLVSLNPGGPNGGSATQYFTGAFDGHRFLPFDTATRWIDYGPDDYAGVTWSNTGKRKIFLGWMNNWQYATLVPTQNWRSSMTVPRELSLEKISGTYFLRSMPAAELKALEGKAQVFTQINLRSFKPPVSFPARLELTAKTLQDFSITLSNAKGQTLLIGYDKASNQFYIDRSASGQTTFDKGFAARHTAPRISSKKTFRLTLLIDKASVELFADDGLTVMTSVFFPDEDFSAVQFGAAKDFFAEKLVLWPLKSVYVEQGR